MAKKCTRIRFCVRQLIKEGKNFLVITRAGRLLTIPRKLLGKRKLRKGKTYQGTILGSWNGIFDSEVPQAATLSTFG